MTAQTAREMVPAIGAKVELQHGALWVRCRVVDVKNSYGRNRLLITPEAGSGEQWIELTSCRVVAEKGDAK